MPKLFFSIIKVLLSIGIASLLLYLVFRNVDLTSFWEKTKEVDYSYVFISIVISSFAYIARAYRWNLQLEPVGYKLKTSRTLLAVLVGYLANMALPRLGEVARCGILKRNENVPIPVAFGTVVVERLLDLLALVVLLVIALILEADLLITFLTTAYADLNLPSWVIILILLIGLGGFIALVVFSRKQKSRGGKIGSLVNEFISGLISLKNIKKPFRLIFSTVFLWVVYFFMAYIIVFSLPETAHLGPKAGLMLLVTGTIAFALPVQSGFGTYHGMVAGLLILYSIEKETGLFLATLLHTSQMIAVAFFGTIAVVISFIIRRKNNVRDQAENTE